MDWRAALVRYGLIVDRQVRRYDSVADAPADLQELELIRHGRNYRGLAALGGLTALRAGSVDQGYLEEIAALSQLTELRIQSGSFTDFSPLGRLRNLRLLRLHDVRAIRALGWAAGIPSLETLQIHDYGKRLTKLDGIEGCEGLRALAVDTAIEQNRTIESLTPLRSLRNLELLSLTGTRVADQSLLPLHDMPSLRYLFSTAYFGRKAREAFEALHRANPELRCSWFDPAVWELLERSRQPRK